MSLKPENSLNRSDTLQLQQNSLNKMSEESTLKECISFRSTNNLDNSALLIEQSDSIRINEKLKDEIEKNKNLLYIRQSELNDLRMKLFPTTASYCTQQELGKEKMLNTERELKVQLKTIDNIESNIADFEAELARINAAKQEAQKLLDATKSDFKVAIDEYLRIQKLMDSLNADMSNKIKIFKDKLNQFEVKKLEIMKNPDLSLVEKKRRIDEINDRMSELRKCHSSEMEIMEKCLEDLQIQSESQKIKFTNEISGFDELLSPSEIERLNRSFNEEVLKNIDLKQEYFQDEHGAYYVDGEKIYKDDGGRFSIDPNSGAKIYRSSSEIDMIAEHNIYSKELFNDSFGNYYVNENGVKTYIDDSDPAFGKKGESKSLKEMNKGVMESYNISKNDIKTHENYLAGLEKGKAKSFQTIEPDKQLPNDEYIKKSLGHPLRLALAATIVHQPFDPINYLANFLLNYRYNELMAKLNEN